MVAVPGLAPGSLGYEPSKELLLYTAINYKIKSNLTKIAVINHELTIQAPAIKSVHIMVHSLWWVRKDSNLHLWSYSPACCH